ncbi:CBS domain-containing protein [Myxosarcina sp. GI1]|uniref:CBS domain-containing protein n=1 Tax=Myxosarcina sp. GI1 TaxID=1541065 RepID=UPI00055D5B39|nr:CBS domain-containing protein [Myxosarcina sp. GI1]
MKASDIMSTNVISIDGLATIAEAARVMQRYRLRALIVDRASDKDAYGIVTATDISRAIANSQHPELTYVCEVMTKPCIVVNPDLAVEHIVKLFSRAKIRVAPVIKDKLLGIVSLTDILSKTNLTVNKGKLQPPNLEEFAELPLDESMDKEWQIETDPLYENWCSG